MRKQYIHYGSSCFDLDIFNEKKANPRDNGFMNKPPYGFWASPVGCDYCTWRNWCEDNDYHTERLEKSFKFTLTKKARILTVKSREDIFPYLIPKKCFGYKVDFYRIMKEYDGMELIHGNRYSELHDNEFYTWDVDSIVIWNPYIIVSVNKVGKEAT